MIDQFSKIVGVGAGRRIRTIRLLLIPEDAMDEDHGYSGSQRMWIVSRVRDQVRMAVHRTGIQRPWDASILRSYRRSWHEQKQGSAKGPQGEDLRRFGKRSHVSPTRS